MSIGVPSIRPIGQNVFAPPHLRVVNASVNANNERKPVPCTALPCPATRNKLLKQHLMFLLHANKCESKEKERRSRGENIVPVSLYQFVL